MSDIVMEEEKIKSTHGYMTDDGHTQDCKYIQLTAAKKKCQGCLVTSDKWPFASICGLECVIRLYGGVHECMYIYMF